MKPSARHWAFKAALVGLVGCPTIAFSQSTPVHIPWPVKGLLDQKPNKEKPPVISLPGDKQKEESDWDRSMKWWRQSVIDQFRITGYRILGYHVQDVSGDREAYNLGNYGGQGGQKFTDTGYLRITGSKVFGTVDFEANIQDARFTDPQAQRYQVTYTNGPWQSEYGDIQTSLPTNNQFVRFNRRLTGVTAGYKSNGLSVKALSSESKGQARTVTIQGTNSAGPYFLQASQIIRGSESIEVDGVPQVFGQDYTIDYELGSVTFMNRVTLESHIIPPSSTIVATYESYNYSGSTGKITGAAMSYNFGSGARVGLTAITQKTGASGRQSTRTEKFQGFGAASTPYILQFTPVDTQPIIVRVDGIIQTEGVDYYFDPGNASIFYFNRFVPPTSEIDVIYTPKSDGGVQGDRENYGLDLALPFAKSQGQIGLTAAVGRLTNSATPTEGMARAYDLRYRTGPFSFQGIVKDVPDDYVSVESTSFNRNEKSNRINVVYQPNSTSRVTTSVSNSSIANLSASGGSSTGRTRFTSTNLSYELTPEKSGSLPLSLNIARMNTKSVSNESKVDRVSLDTAYRTGQFSSSLSLANSKVTGSSNSSIFSLSTQLGYLAGSKWSFASRLGISQVKTGGESGFGHDYSLSAFYRPSDNLSTSLSWTDSQAGSVTSLSNYDSGFGAGYDGNGFTSGANSLATNGATNGRTVSFTFSWDVSKRISFDGILADTYRTGNISSNSETKLASFSGNYDLGRSYQARGSLSRSVTDFVDSPLNSSATTYDFQLVGRPSSRFGFTTTLSGLLSGGTSTYQQNSSDFELTLNYLLAKRHSLALNYSSNSTSGYYPQGDKDTSLTYRYQIWESLAFNASYRFRDVVNLDPALTSGAYRSSGFDFSLAFNFFR